MKSLFATITLILNIIIIVIYMFLVNAHVGLSQFKLTIVLTVLYTINFLCVFTYSIGILKRSRYVSDSIAILRTGNNDCSKYVQQSRQNNGTKKLTFNSLSQNLELWQGIVLMMAFGAFALFIAIIHRIVR